MNGGNAGARGRGEAGRDRGRQERRAQRLGPRGALTMTTRRGWEGGG